jgi:hypothetical protein
VSACGGSGQTITLKHRTAYACAAGPVRPAFIEG